MTEKDIQIQHLLDNLYTQEDAEAIFRNLQNDVEYENLFKERMDELWENFEDYPENSDMENHRYKKEAVLLLQKINKKQFTIRPYILRTLSVAASILILLTLGIGIYRNNPHLQEKNSIYSEASTPFGKIQVIELPDGTVVTLNACSHLIFPDQFNGDERKVTLEGEAYFQVARNEKQPFIITTDNFNVKVLGTEFNIKAYSLDGTQTVSVKSGKVQVEMPEATIRLIADEQLELDLLNESFSKQKENQSIATWMRGSLSFNKTPIRDVANELERVYNWKIVFKEGQEFDNLITGEHSNKSLKAVLKSIEYTSGIHFKIDEEEHKIILYR
jgi:ferric-dicitrate binding protein FerR (iron transport regulator)